MTEILLIRHAYSLANNANWNNQSGIVHYFPVDRNCPIENHYGEKQAKELNYFLKGYLKDRKILLIRSPYLRVEQTARIALEGINIEKELIDETLREINQGLSYGRNKQELEELLIQKNISLLDYTNIKNPYPFGESEEDVRIRVNQLAINLKQFAQHQTDYDNIIIFAHETINKWMYYWLMSEEINMKQKTTEVISTGKQKVLYTPKTMVPKGFSINFEEYK